MACLNDCREMLREGGSVLFFPEGTRSTTGEMDSFKKGAFSVAAKERVPVVPITLVGTGQILTSGAYAYNLLCFLTHAQAPRVPDRSGQRVLSPARVQRNAEVGVESRRASGAPKGKPWTAA